MTRRRHLRTGLRWLRLLFTVGLLAWLGLRLDWSALRHWSGHASAWLLGALALVAAGNVVAGWRWALLMRAGDFRVGRFAAVRWYIAGGLLNQGLPSVVGGDAYRVWAAVESELQHAGAHLRAARVRAAGLIAVLDRGVGLYGSMILAAAGMSVAGAALAPWAPRAGLLGLGALIAGWALAGLLARRFAAGRGLRAALRATLSPGIVAMSVAVYVLNAAAMAMCLRAAGAAGGAWAPALAMLLPALGLLVMLPFSVAGWGVRETALSAALLLWGVPAATTVAASLAFGLVTLASLLPGAATLIASPLSAAEAPSPKDSPT